MENLQASTFKGYNVGKMLGDGGFGKVYQATQSAIRREVAIKVIHKKYANNPDFIRRFEAEAHIISRLEHPHITPLYDFWREPDGAYLVMRFLRGGSIKDVLENEGAYELESASRLLDQIASALDFAHRNNVIHRDIKPHNILLDEDGNAYLADFGIAKDLSGVTDNKTNADAVVGSLDYISPEQARSEPVTPRTDIYSLGVTLYEMISGQHPFYQFSTIERLYKHINEPLPPIENLPEDMSDTVNYILQKATAKDPDKRYDDVLALAVAFSEGVGRGKSASQELNVIEELTMREHEILGLIAKGMSNQEIAEYLVIAKSTVRWHINQLYKKLGVRGRVQAIVRARELNLIVTGDTINDFAPTVIDGVTGISLPEPENPYKGLHAFQPADARDFFGRDELTQKLLGRMNSDEMHHRFLSIIGPSGSGKSSLVKAGLIPALWRGAIPGSKKWFVVDMIPGTHPLDKLEIALLRVASNHSDNLREQLQRDERGLLRVADLILPQDDTELVIVVDQLEEVFTLVEEEASRQQFLDLLRAAVTDTRSRVRVIVTLRADYYDRPLQYPEFGDLLRSRMETILPLSVKGLERAIQGPAERVGVAFEQGLITQIVSDMNYQSGALPLLQYALTELFDRRDGRLLTHEAYQKIGGAVGALANRADEIYRSMAEDSQNLAHQMFLRLVTLGEGAEDTRRRVTRAELLSLADDIDLMEEVIDSFASYRLLSLDNDADTRQPTVEVAHEAILREWERLRGWLNESREDIRQERELARATGDWESHNRDASYLLHGTRLEQVEAWQQSTELTLTPLEIYFIETSLEQRKARKAEELAQQAYLDEQERLTAEQKERNRKLLQTLVAVFAIATVVSSILGIYAFIQQQTARDALVTAEREADTNRSLVLANEAGDAYLTGETDLALALALEAVNLDNPPQESIRALGEVARGTGTRAVLNGHTNDIRAIAISPDNRFAASGSCAELTDDTCEQGDLILWNLEQASPVWRIEDDTYTDWISGLAFSPDSTLLLVSSTDGSVTLRDVESGEVVREFAGHEGAVNAVAYHPSGDWIATAGADSRIILWHAMTGEIIRSFEDHTGSVNDIIFNLDGSELLSGSDDTLVILWNTNTGEIIQTYEQVTTVSNDIIGVDSVAFDHAHSYILASNTVNFQWDKESAEIIRATGSALRISDLVVGIDGIIYDGMTGYVRVTYPETDNRNVSERLLYDHQASVSTVAISADNRILISGDVNGTLRVWNLNAQLIREIPVPASPSWLRLSPDETSLLVGSFDVGKAFIYDLDTGTVVHEFDGDYSIAWTVAYSPDGRYAAVGYINFYVNDVDNALILWDTTTGEIVHELVGHEIRLSDVAFSPDGRYLLSGSQNFAFEGELFLWDVETGELIRRFDNESNIASVAITSDGLYAVTSSFFGQNVAVWDMASGTKLRQQDFTSPIYVSLLTADDESVLLGFTDGRLLELDVETLETSRSFEGHTGEVWDIALSSDEQLMVSGQHNGTAILWDYITGRELGRVTQPGGFYTNVAFGPDDNSIFTSAYSGNVLEWYVSNQSLDELITWVEDNRYIREFTCEERIEFRIEPLCEADS